MIPENPGDDAARSLLATVHPEAIGTEMRLKAMRTANAGFVVWDAHPPANETWSQHRRVFMEAMFTGLSFCRTDTRNEWCILGSTALTVVRMLEEYSYVEGIDCHPLVFIGKLRTISVYTASSSGGLDIAAYVFFVGVEDRCCVGQIHNYPG